MARRRVLVVLSLHSLTVLVLLALALLLLSANRSLAAQAEAAPTGRSSLAFFYSLSSKCISLSPGSAARLVHHHHHQQRRRPYYDGDSSIRTSFPLLHRPGLCAGSAAASSSSPSSSDGISHAPVPVKRSTKPPADLPDFVTFKRNDYDPIGSRKFVHSVTNFITRAIDVWKPETDARGKRRRRRPSGAGEWARFIKATLSEKRYLTLSSLALIGAACCEVSVPHYSSMALNAVLVSRDMKLFVSAVRTLVSLGCIASFLTFIRAALFGLAGTRVATRARVQLLKSLLMQELGFFDNKETGELTNRLSADCAKLSTVISSHINVMLRQSIQLLGGSYYLFRINRPLACVTLLGVTAIGVLTALHGAFIRRMGRRSQDALAQANAVAGQILSLIRVIRSHGSEERELTRYGAELKRTVEMLEMHDLGHSVYRTVVRFLQTFLQAGVMGMGALYTLDGRMTGEQLTSFLFYVNFVSAASFDVGDRWTSIQDAIGSTASVFSLTDRRPRLKVHPQRSSGSRNQHQSDGTGSISSSSSSGSSSGSYVTVATQGHHLDSSSSSSSSSPPPPPRGMVVFRNCTFAYPLRGAVPVLRNVNLVIPPGKKTAVVGGSGAGKSTLMRLLCRFYDPDHGCVLLDGRDVRSLTQRELTTRIVFLPQEPQLMPISIFENIAYGLDEGSVSNLEEVVVRAAMEANVHDFIVNLPQGYRTSVGENSVDLSGGQKQRIAIARALTRRPEVLLLDEPSSALDPESEKVVAEALDLASAGRTVIIIAHRLQTIKNVDWIVTMEHGRVVEEGTHSTLMANRGTYARLYETYKNAMA